MQKLLLILFALSFLWGASAQWDDYYDYYWYDNWWDWGYDFDGFVCSWTNDGAGPTPADGWCDAECNNEEFNWDGGDCCEETCTNSVYECGLEVPYNCHTDPGFEQYWYEDDLQGCDSGYVFGPIPGDGWCDSACNSEQYEWDGGDCCVDTCKSGSFECGTPYYNCHTSPDFHQYPEDESDWWG